MRFIVNMSGTDPQRSKGGQLTPAMAGWVGNLCLPSVRGNASKGCSAERFLFFVF
ncbi:hypothetical protein ACE6H2_003899 [Prunus campanulata]